MQTCLLVLGFFLAGQISGSSGTRYPVVPPDTPPQGGTVETTQPPAGQQPWTDQSTAIPPTQPQVDRLRSAIPPATPPRATQPPATKTAPTGLTKVIKPADLLQSLVKPVGIEKLVGVPMSLGEAIQNARSRAEQTRRVKLYWELSQAVTAYHLTSREEIELQSLHRGLGQVGGPGQNNQAWGLAQQTVAARKQVARSAVEVAQLRLQKELGLLQNAPRRAEVSNLPLPSDLPHCGAYETKYEQIFRGRTSREAEQLSKLLPLRHGELGQRALDSSTARERLIAVSKQRSPQSDSTPLLKSYEQLALQRQTFVATAYQYNANIARYAELAVPQEIGTMRLVAMLIQSDGESGGEWQSGAIRRATAEETVPRNNGGQHQPRTYAEGGRNSALRVPTGESKGERSILVKPQGAGR